MSPRSKKRRRALRAGHSVVRTALLVCTTPGYNATFRIDAPVMGPVQHPEPWREGEEDGYVNGERKPP